MLGSLFPLPSLPLFAVLLFLLLSLRLAVLMMSVAAHMTVNFSLLERKKGVGGWDRRKKRRGKRNAGRPSL
jgi:hypothetical protein